MLHRRVTAGVVAGVALVACLQAQAASAAYPHTVAPGESLWSIALANNFTTRTIAAFNGLPEDALLFPGDIVQIPTDAEGASALWAAGIVPGSPPVDTGAGLDAADAGALGTDAVAPAAVAAAPAAGSLGLAPGAAESWEAMRQEAYEVYGSDLYGGGPLSGFRTYADQSYLYDLYLSGAGAPANPPGMSWHELGLSVDLATPEMRQIVDEIGWKYGWSKVDGPGEWWHVDYVGG